MPHARTLVLASISLTSLLAGCDGLHAPSEQERRASKLEAIASRAREVGNRVVFSPDAVAVALAEEDGSTKEVSKPVLSPADAAKRLRELATEADGAKASDLAKRLRRDALMLDVLALEWIARRRIELVDDLAAGTNAIISIRGSGELDAGTRAESTAAAMEKAHEAFRKSLDGLGEQASAARDSLKPVESRIAEMTGDAEALESKGDELRAEAMTSTSERAVPRMAEARQKIHDAQDLRVAAAEADRNAEAVRSELRIREAALRDSDAMTTRLAAQVARAREAAEGANARADGSKARLAALDEECGPKRRELARHDKDEFDPALQSIAESFESMGPAGSSPADAASVALLRARVESIRIGAIDADVRLARLDAAARGTDAPEPTTGGDRDAALRRASDALLAAREALRGSETPESATLRAAIDACATALGLELPAAPTPDAPAPESPAPDAPAPDAPAPDAPAPDAPAPDAPAPGQPETPPSQDPDAPPAGPDEPAPPPSEPSDPDEPNK